MLHIEIPKHRRSLPGYLFSFLLLIIVLYLFLYSMGAEQLEESEFEPMFEEVKTKLGGKRIGLFGSYGWGDGEWMRIWEDDCSKLGCTMAAGPVLANGAPDDTAAEECRALGGALA